MTNNSFKKNLLATASVFAIGAFAASGASAAVTAITAAQDLDNSVNSYTFNGAASWTASDTANLAFGNIGVADNSVFNLITTGGTGTLTLGGVTTTNADITYTIANDDILLLTSADNTSIFTLAEPATVTNAAGTGLIFDIDEAHGGINVYGNINQNAAVDVINIAAGANGNFVFGDGTNANSTKVDTGSVYQVDGAATGNLTIAANYTLADITASADGIINIDDVLTGSITNNGTIDASGAGVGINIGANVTLGVINAGTISGTTTGNAIIVSGGHTSSNTNGAIYNTGTITGTASTNGVIDINAAIVNSTTAANGLVNTGTIEDLGEGEAITIAAAVGIVNSSTGIIRSASTAAGTITQLGANTQAITNAGTISNTTTGSAIKIAAGDMTGALTNTGTISSGGLTIDVDTDIVGGIINSGASASIKSTGAATSAIDIVAGANATAITNTLGTITAAGSAATINYAGALTAGILTNTGTISNTGTGAAIDYQTGAIGSNLNNTGGTITSASTVGTIVVGGLAAHTIANTGTITNTGIAGEAINLDAAGTKIVITNSSTGVITGNHATTAATAASYGTGNAIDASASTTAAGLTLTNAGTIYGDVKTVTTQTSTINLNTVNTLATVATSGLVGNIVVAGTTTNSAINFNQGAGAAQYYGGTITGTAGLGAVTAQTGNTYLTSKTASTTTSTGGLAINTLTVDSGAGLFLASTNAGGSIAANAQARVASTVTVNGTLGVGAYNSVTSADGLVTGAASTIRIGVVGSTAGTYGKIDVTDTTAAAGSTITIDPTSIGYIASGTVLDKVIESDASTTNFAVGTLTESTESYIYSFASSADADTHSVDVTVTRENTFDDTQTLSTGAQATNINAVGDALETIALTGDADLDTVVNALNGMTTAAQINAALATLVPDMSGAISAAAVTAADAGFSTVNDRLDELASISGSTVATGGSANKSGVWGKVFGTSADQDWRDGVEGYQADTLGFGIGGDTAVSDQAKIGAALAYANTSADSANGDADIDSYQITGYGTYDYGKWYSEALVGFTHNTFDTKRNVVVGAISDQAKGDFDGQQYTAKIGAGYKLAVEGGLNVTPVASLKYDYITFDKYTETGSSADLTVDNDAISSLKSNLGVKLNYPIVNGGLTYIPEISAGWTYDFVGDEQEASNNFTGASSTLFTTKGADVAQSALNVGLGLDVLAQDNVTVSFDYDWTNKADYNAHSGAVKARFSF